MLRKAFITIAALGAFVVPSHADDITEAFKRDALLRVYKANGNSMTRWGSIDIKDLTEGTPLISPGSVEPWSPAKADVDSVPPPAPKKR